MAKRYARGYRPCELCGESETTTEEKEGLALCPRCVARIFEETPAEAGERAARADVRRAKEDAERAFVARAEKAIADGKTATEWANEEIARGDRKRAAIANGEEPEFEADSREDAEASRVEAGEVVDETVCANCGREADLRRKFDREPFCLECVRDHGEDADDYEFA